MWITRASPRPSFSPPLLEAIAPLLAPQPLAPLDSFSVERPSGPARAEGFVAVERARTELEKYRFSPELEAKVAAENAKRAADPSHKKPPIDLAGTTARVDAILNDPSLSSKEKKQKVEVLRKELGLPKRGKVSMNSLFTGRLGGIYGDSKKRVDAERKAHEQGLRAELAAVERAEGKGSPRALALKAELEATKGVYGAERERLGKLEREAKKMYPKPRGFFSRLFGAIGGFFKKVGRGIAKVAGVIGKVVGFAMPLIKMIPGVGQIAGAVWGGIKAVGSLVKGNLKGALGAVLGALPIPGGLGGIASKLIGAGSASPLGALTAPLGAVAAPLRAVAAPLGAAAAPLRAVTAPLELASGALPSQAGELIEAHALIAAQLRQLR